jgi:hypothetical protein
MDNLTAALAVRDPYYLMHYIDSMRVYKNPEILVLWHNLWEENKDKYPNFAWTCIEHPLVKVILAEKLAHADPENYETYHRYIEDNLDHDDQDVRMQAVTALGGVGSTRSIPRLEALALSKDTELALIAISALALLRTDEARAVLERLYRDPNLQPIRRRTIRDELGGEFRESLD